MRKFTTGTGGRALVALGVVALSSAAAAQPLTAIIEPSADTSIYSESDDLSNGAGAFLFAGPTAGGSVRRALLKFDIARALPPHAPIGSVTLDLTVSKSVSGASNVDLLPLDADWGEGASNAGDPGGLGAFATLGDTTWALRFYGTDSWATPGGDFQATPSGTTAVAGLGTYTWTSAAMAADVQRWLDAPETNFGWLVRGDEGSPGVAKRYNSREHGTLASRPHLTIQYYCPADFDRNDFVNGDDFDFFMEAFFFGHPEADWDRNTFVNGDDFDGFALAFFFGC